jgi:hypothetical protein
MLQIGGAGQGFDSLVGKLTGKNVFQFPAEFLTRKLARRAFEINAHKFETVRTRAPEALHGKHQARLRMIGDGYDAPREVVLFGPDVQQGLSPEPRTSHESFDKGVRRPPFSQSSAAPADANSRRRDSSSAASFTPPFINETRV